SLNQPSTVKPPVPVESGRREGESGISTYWLLPLNVNAWPTRPGVVVAPTKTPLFGGFVPEMSSALPFPAHQAAMPGGGGVQTEPEGPFLHFPDEPAPKIAAISLALRAWSRISTSSIRPATPKAGL